MLVFLLLLASSFGASAQSPFTSEKSPPATAPGSPSLHPYPFLARIAAWQQQLNRKMAALTRQARETGNIRPFLFLIAISVVYGILHAAGPGHGKAVATSYLVSQDRQVGSGILVGNLIALSHGLSGIALVLAVHFILRRGLGGSLENVSHVTQIISYSLIVLLGMGLLARNILRWRRPKASQPPNPKDLSIKSHRGPLALALTVGMVPCPGVVLVMLFCLSLNMVGVGLLLAFGQILGMAVTISAVGVAGVAGKNLALGAVKGKYRVAEVMEKGVETAAALLLTALGLLLLAATL
jgi:ABC-type nickel/cobalt efflux system permease component RcnA